MQKWTSQISTEEIYQAALGIWDKALRDVSDAEIKKSLDQLLDKFPEWPPSVGEFKQLCSLARNSSELSFYRNVKVNREGRSPYVSHLLQDYCDAKGLPLPGVIRREL